MGMQSWGTRIRAARAHAGLSQTDLGRICGYSQSAISRIELDEASPTPAEMRTIARALGIKTGLLIDAGESEDDVRRRQMLGAATAGIGAALLPATSAAAQTSEWDTVLLARASRPSTETTAQFTARLNKAVEHCASARYRQAGRAVPGLIQTAEYLAKDGRRSSQALLARAYVLATAVAVKERDDLSMVTADRAMQAAHRSGDPLAHAMAARAQYIVLRQRGHHTAARQLAATTVSELADEPGTRPVLGHLLLENAYGAAQAGNGAAAEALWDQAQDFSRRGPQQIEWADHAGPLTPDQVERYGLCVHHVLGDSSKALKHMTAVGRYPVATPERQARVLHDSAKLHRDLGDLPKTLELLRKHESAAPQDARRTSVRTMVAHMQVTSPGLPGLGQFAARIGA